MIWLPLLLSAGVVYWVSTKRLVQTASCKALPPEERAHIDRVLSVDDAELHRMFGSAAMTRAELTNGLHLYAADVERRGCPDEARALHARANAIASAAPTMASTGQFAAYLTAPGPAYEPPSPAPPAAPPPSPAPIAIPFLCYTVQRTWVRPEPRAWNDADGRFGFSIPRGYPVVAVLSGGPPGWAHVRLHHPDHGVVDGWVEIARLAKAPPPPAPPPRPNNAAPRQNGAPRGRPFTMPPPKKKKGKTRAPLGAY